MKILQAASSLFYAHGIHAIGVDTIAAHAGVSKKTLYERFGSKERLITEYLIERDSQWCSFLTDRLEWAATNPAERVAAIFHASAEWAAQRGTKGCGMINAHAEISDPAHPAYAVIVGQKRWMLTLFHTEAHHICPSESEELAEQLMLLHEGAMVSAGMDTFEGAFDRAIAVARHLMTRAL